MSFTMSSHSLLHTFRTVRTDFDRGRGPSLAKDYMGVEAVCPRGHKRPHSTPEPSTYLNSSLLRIRTTTELLCLIIKRAMLLLISTWLNNARVRLPIFLASDERKREKMIFPLFFFSNLRAPQRVIDSLPLPWSDNAIPNINNHAIEMIHWKS